MLIKAIMLLKAIIFDASGTILDDLYVVWKANSDAYEALGFKGFETLEDFKLRFKLPVPEFHQLNGIPPDFVEEVDKKFREFYPRYSSQVKLFPEVKEVLGELSGKGILLGVASNIPSAFLREHLRRFGLENYLSVITGQEDCKEQKPSPKPILITLEKLGIRPSEAAYVGDMEEDIIAGKKANTHTIGINRSESYHPLWKLERQRPEYVISNLKELLDII